jgi:predicted dehydrogenase
VAIAQLFERWSRRGKSSKGDYLTKSQPEGQQVCLEEEWTRGYLQEIQDFMECAATGRQPLSDLALALETIKVNYAGYWAADEGRRVKL